MNEVDRRDMQEYVDYRIQDRFGPLIEQWLESLPETMGGRCSVGRAFTDAVNKVLNDGGEDGPTVLQQNNEYLTVRGNEDEMQRDPGDVLEDAFAAEQQDRQEVANAHLAMRDRLDDISVHITERPTVIAYTLAEAERELVRLRAENRELTLRLSNAGLSTLVATGVPGVPEQIRVVDR